MLRIKDWEKCFENNRTRHLKHLTWLPLPNKQDGDGYTELVSHKDGDRYFGAWCAILQVASKCDPRGTLVRDGGRPHTPDTLGRITRLPEKTFRDAIPRLLTVGWLETYDDPTTISHEGAVISHEGAAFLNGMEGKGRERKDIHIPPARSRENATSMLQAFEECWEKYPDKSGKSQALKAFLKHKPSKEDVLAGIRRYLAYVEGRRRDGFKDLRYKNGSTFFNNQEWLSEWTIRPNQPIDTRLNKI